MIQNFLKSPCAPSLDELIYLGNSWDESTSESQILTSRRNSVYIYIYVWRSSYLETTSFSVEVCEACACNCLSPHHCNTFNRWCCRFHMSLQNGDHSSPQDFCSLSLQPPTSLSGLHAPKLLSDITLSFFFLFSFLLFLLQNIQRHTCRLFYPSTCCETELKRELLWSLRH